MNLKIVNAEGAEVSWAEIELRIIAALDHQVQQAIENMISEAPTADAHARTASKIYGVPVEEVTPDQRRLAKAVNFGVIYSPTRGW